MPPDPVVPTYLDHAASTPMRPEAVEAMVPFLAVHHGNPSGSHAAARHARRAVDDARDAIAALVGCRPGDVVFTSGGTEADVTALTGAVTAHPGPVAVSSIEHAAVLDTVRGLAAAGVPVVELPVDPRGRVDLDAVPADAAVVSVGLANNEVGTIHPLEALAERAPGAVIHTDAVQAAAWLDLPTLAAPAHLVALSAHKLGGPKGVGALVVRDGTVVAPLLTGGGQERGRRSGTQNVPGIVAFGVAARLAVEERDAKATRVRALRDRLAAGLRAAVPDAIETVVPAGADRAHVLPGHLHLCLPGTAADEVLFLLDQEGVAATAASSCASGATSPSHVLAALGVPDETARGSLRLTLGWSSTDTDVDRAIQVIPAVVAKATA